MSESSVDDVEPRIPGPEHDPRLIEVLERLAERAAAPACKPRRNWDALAAVIASLIGLVAVAVSGYTAYVQREQLRAQGEQLRAQVWPHLQLSYSNTGSVGMFVTNQGTGPAQRIVLRVAVDGMPVARWADVKKAAGYSPGEGVIISQINSTVIPAGKEIAIVRPDDRERSLSKFRELLPGGKHAVEVTLCYCSVLDECWAAGASLLLESTVPSPLGSCPIARDDLFLE